jgi:transposase
VIGLPRGVSVYAFDEPTDMRKSFDTLTALVTEHMKRDVLAGDLFLFVSRDRRRAKVSLPRFGGHPRGGYPRV